MEVCVEALGQLDAQATNANLNSSCWLHLGLHVRYVFPDDLVKRHDLKIYDYQQAH